jgi:hypothetical protein
MQSKTIYAELQQSELRGVEDRAYVEKRGSEYVSCQRKEYGTKDVSIVTGI